MFSTDGCLFVSARDCGKDLSINLSILLALLFTLLTLYGTWRLTAPLDLSHLSVSCCVLHWGFFAFYVICQQQKNGVNTALCWSYVQSWKCIQHVWKLNLNVFWQEGSRAVYFGYMLAFPALLNVTIFIFMYQILVIQYTCTKHWFLYTVYHFSRYCVWI